MPVPSSSQKFVKSLKKGFSSLCDLNEDDLNDEELSLLYPRQEQIKHNNERYAIKNLIGQGGMKKVYLAKDYKANCNVALATPSKNVDDKQTIEDFFKEAQICASLRHPNIIPIHDMGFIDEEAFFTMEFLGGKNLAQFIKAQNNLADEQDLLFDVFNKICDAVSYAHSAKILHLDLKPENIQIGDFGEVYVCDWGLAKNISTTDLTTQAASDFDQDTAYSKGTLNGEIKGTLGFMAPEQANSESKDERTDIFMLGGILYFILTGRSPIQSNQLSQSIKKTQRAKISSWSENDVGSGLVAIVKKSLNRDPIDRYQSIKDLQVDFNKFRHGFATSAQNASIFTRVQLMVKRHSQIVKYSLIFIIFSIVILSIAFYKTDKARRDAITQKELAEKHRISAEYQEKLAKKNLALFEVKKQESEEFLISLLGIYNTYFENKEVIQVDSSLKAINHALEIVNPQDRPKILRNKIYLKFITQDFESCNKIFLELENDPIYTHKHSMFKNLRHLSETFEKTKRSQSKLTNQDMAQLLRQLPPRQKKLADLCFLHHMEHNNNSALPHYMELASIMLNFTNFIRPGQNTYRDVKIDTNCDLDLSHMPIKLLRIDRLKRNIFSHIPLNTLNLSYTNFDDFDQLVEIKCNTLNITGCAPRLNHNIQLLRYTGLKTIIYSPELITAQNQEVLAKYFKLIPAP